MVNMFANMIQKKLLRSNEQSTGETKTRFPYNMQRCRQRLENNLCENAPTAHRIEKILYRFKAPHTGANK